MFKISKRAVIGLAVGALALTGLGLAGTASAAPAPGTASAPSNVVTLPANVRVPGFSVPNGGPLFNGHDVTVQATGAAAGLADPGATAVLVKVTAFNPTGTGQLVAHATGTGAPGNPTVAYTKGSENSGVAWVKLDAAGTFVIEEEGAATHALVEIDAESVLPADPTVGNVLHNSFGSTVPPNGQAQVAATCAGTADDNLITDPGYPIGGDAANGPATDFVAVGGGYSVGNGSGSVTGVNVSMSRDELTGTNGKGWLVTFQNTTDTTQTVRTWVVCLKANDNPND